MRRFTKKSIICIFALLLTVLFGVSVSADDITANTRVTLSDGGSAAKMLDRKISTFVSVEGSGTVTLSSDSEISGFYVVWNKIPGIWSYKAGENELNGGENGFLHEYVPLPSPAAEIVISVPSEGAEITDIYAFSEGELPDWVQVWEKPCEAADLLLFSTHSDDEQLFFAGLLPYYAIEVGASVQVVYLTNHFDTVTRPHEQLNGLWTVGIRNYPVISDFPDLAGSLGKESESRQTVLERTKKLYDEEEWILFQVRQLRRFKPQVVVGHDLDGEYRHGAHILNSHALMSALELSRDPEYDTASVQEYGIWEVKKTYFHLYSENKIVMNWDTPYESMGGKTAFEMSKLGFACHDSQQWTWFKKWLDKPTAAEIKGYNPCYYGLYQTTVGYDSGKNDLLENITLYKDIFEQQRLAEIEEQERLRAEESAKAESIAAESKRLESEKAESIAIESLKNHVVSDGESEDRNMTALLLPIAAVFIIAFGTVLIVLCLNNRKTGRKRRKKEILQMTDQKTENIPVRRKPRRERSAVGRIFGIIGKVLLVLVTAAAAAAAALIIVLNTICNGPSKSAKEVFVTSVLESGQMKFLASLFLSDEEINEIVSATAMGTLDKEVDSGLIFAEDTENTEESIYDFDENGIDLIEISGRTYFAKLLVIKDPSKVTLATTYPWSEYGKELGELVTESGAVAGVNGGLYYSSGNKGGYPLGVAVSNGEIQYNRPENWPGLYLIGFDSEDILQIINIHGMSAAKVKTLIEERGIRDAVTFQDESSDANNHFVPLIINGEPRELSGKGSGANPRTAIGQRADGSVLLLVTDGRGAGGHLGATASDLISIMSEHGAVNAANLDGGSSSCMYYNGGYEMTSVTLYYANSSWRLPTAFVVEGGASDAE